MEIMRAGARPSAKGPTDWFTGAVRIDPLFNPHAPERVQGAHVTFEPGARTAWHTHPLGQTLIVRPRPRATLARRGRGNPPRRCGVVRPGEKHWRGAAPETAMTHIAVQEVLDGKVVEWMEQVSDKQYGA